MAIQSFTKTGSKGSSVTSPKVLSEKVESTDLLKQAFLAYEDQARERLASVKTRSEVRGGGRKPWRQKGTGRARAGTIRSPLWRSGGVIFGPTNNRNYSNKLNRSMKQKALKQALSLAIGDKRVSVIESFEVKDGKTASAAKIIKNTGLDRGILLVVESPTEMTVRATNNLPNVLLVSQPSLNAYDVLKAHQLIITKDALKNLEARLSGGKQ